MSEVKLLGKLSSPFVCRVIWALKQKGIPYEFIEEDLSNKSPLLLKHNPVYKKIPVLVHGEKSVCESMIIVQYIDEMWPQNSLLPSDPYEMAVARFWVKFAEDKGQSVWRTFHHFFVSENLEQAMKETLEMLQTAEEHCMLGEKKYFGGDKINMADIAFGAVVYWLQILEELIEVKLLDAHKLPRLYSWITNFKQEPLIKENTPDLDWLLSSYKRLRETMSASA